MLFTFPSSSLDIISSLITALLVFSPSPSVTSSPAKSCLFLYALQRQNACTKSAAPANQHKDQRFAPITAAQVNPGPC
ncbi:hypothetical protein V8C35DRAFT_287359 [Trichoderma chlorosporum]